MRTTVISLAIVATAVAASGAELTLMQQVTITGRDGVSRDVEQTVYLASSDSGGELLDIVRVKRGEDDVILRGDKKVLWSLDHMLRTYEEMRLDEMKTRWERVNEEALEAIRNLPDGARKWEMIESLDNDSKKWDIIWNIEDDDARERLAAACGIPSHRPVYEVGATGEEKEIAGFTCSEYVVTEDGVAVHRAWITPTPALHPDVFEWLNLTNIMDGTLAAELKKVGGLPLELRMWEGYQGAEITTTIAVSRKAHPRGKFSVPRGYNRPRNR